MTHTMKNEWSQGTAEETFTEARGEPVFKTVLCPKCGKRMLIEAGEEPREHRCPVCKAAFTTTWHDGVLTVVFEEHGSASERLA